MSVVDHIRSLLRMAKTYPQDLSRSFPLHQQLINFKSASRHTKESLIPADKREQILELLNMTCTKRRLNADQVAVMR